MRRGLLLVLGMLAWAMALMAVPAPVQARDLPGALLGVITRPLGAILGGPRYGRRSYRHRRAAASRSRAVQATPAQVEAARAAAVAGTATAGTAAVAATAAGTTQAEAKTSTEAVAQPDSVAAPAQAKPAVEAKSVETKPAPAAATAAVAAAPVAPTPAVTVAPLPAVSAPAKATTAAIINEAKTEPKPEPKAEAKPVEAKPATPVPEVKEAKPATVVAEPKPEPAVQAKVEPVAPPPAAAPLPTPAPAQRSAALSQPPARQQPTAAPAARGTLRSGVTGPLTWPTALEDVVGFAMWAGEYSERLRGHGIGDVLNAVMVPADALAARIRPGGVNVAARTDARRNPAPAGGGSLGVCNMEPAADDWLVTTIERSIEPNAEQRAALTQLKNAFSEAAVRVRAACRDDGSPTSAERLGAMQSMLWAVHDATIQLRGPIAKFYGSLTAEQRQKFAAAPSAQVDPRSMAPQAIARLCGAPQSGDAMLRQAEQSLNLNRAQRLSLDTFQKKSAEMGQFLMASCLKPVASTPVERIDAAADRLTALIFAASTVNLALNDFYNQLSNEQRTKFDAAVR